MKRVLVLCSFLVGCGGLEQEKPEVTTKSQALIDYSSLWAGPLSGGTIGTYQLSNGDTAIDQFQIAGQTATVLDVNLVNLKLGNQGAGQFAGISINTTNGTNAVVNRTFTSLPSTLYLQIAHGQTTLTNCVSSNFTVGPNWHGATRTYQSCGPGKSQYQIQVTATGTATFQSTCGLGTSPFVINATWTAFTPCTPNGDWTCWVEQTCSDGMHLLQGHYDPISGSCTPLYPVC